MIGEINARGEPTLTLGCANVPIDSVRFEREKDGEIYIRVSEAQLSEEGSSAVYLSPEDARMLFNWLGVQLHR